MINEWVNEERTIALSTFSEPIEWPTYMAGVEEMILMLDEVDHTVMSISDYSTVETLPSGVISRLPEIAKLARHPNFGEFILFGVSTHFGRAAISLFERVYGKVHLVDTREEAVEVAERLLRADDA